MRRTAFVVLIVLAGCLAPAMPKTAAPDDLGTRETTPGASLDFAVPRPVEGARYVWSFGDGGSSLGTSARHAWTRPGVYTVAWQEMQGEKVVRASTGLVRVHMPLRLADTATPALPSEEHFEVFPNATSVTMRFAAPAGAGRATVILADPSGAPKATETIDLSDPADLAFEVDDPAQGSWFVYVEIPDGEVAWTAEGVVEYG